MKELVHGQPHPGVTAAYGGVCSDCGQPYPPGGRIVRWKRGDRSWAHRHCPPAADPTTDRATDPANVTVPANVPAGLCASCGGPDPDATLSWARGPTLAVHTRCLPALADQLTQPEPADPSTTAA